MVALTLGTIYVGLLLLKLTLVYAEIRRQRRELRRAAGPDVRGVTILQPILSGDPYLEAVLEENLRTLEAAQFFWLLDTDDAAAHVVAQRLQSRHPQRTIRTFSSAPAPDGVNPKTFKLDLALESVTTSIVVVLDDDSRLPGDTLRALAMALDTADLSTALPFSRDDRHLASRLLSQFVNNNSAMTYLPLLRFLSPVTINGMCYALRLSYLRRLGGFSTITRHLTDDLAMARMVIAHGGRIHQSIAPVEVQTGVSGAGSYVRQMHRWFLFATLLMRRQTIAVNLVITVLHGLPPLLLWGLIICVALRPTPAIIVWVTALLALRAASLIAMQRILSGASRMRPILSIFSELLQPWHFFHALLQRTIRWRTRRYIVLDNDCFRTCR
jgi:ceramide glucosyltransferase